MATSNSGLRLGKRALRSGASFERSCSVGDSWRAAGRSWVTSGLVSLENLVRRASVMRRLALEGRQGAEGLLELAVARRGGREDACWSSSISERSWPSRSLRASKTSPVSRTTPCTSVLLGVEDLQQRRGVLARTGARLPSASEMSRPRPCEASASCCIQTRNAVARLRVEGAEDLVELDGRRHRAGGQAAVLGDRARRSWSRASARRRSRPAASSGAGSPSCPWGSARTRGRARSSRPRRRSACRALIDLDLADRDAGDPHVGLRGTAWPASREGDVEAVALGLQRDRAAEGQPQEEQQAEAGQREAAMTRMRPRLGACFCI